MSLDVSNGDKVRCEVETPYDKIVSETTVVVIGEFWSGTPLIVMISIIHDHIRTIYFLPYHLLQFLSDR